MKTLYQIRWQVGAVLTTFMWIAMFLLVASTWSCTSLYDRAKARYMHEGSDTTFSTVTATVPAETLRTVFRTDTTHFIERIRQGRASMTIIREPTNTTVIANCDSASTTKQVATQIRNEEWSEDSKYKRYALIAIVVSAILFGLLLIILSLGFMAYKLSQTYTLNKRGNGASAVNPG